MDTSRQEYATAFAALPPLQAASILNERMRHVSTLNLEIADWLEERRQVEAAYVQGMNRLYRKQPPGDLSDLGIFTGPWSKIVSSTGAIAESHNLLAHKIEIDIEKPLREYATSNRDVQQMTTMQGNLSAIAKEYDNAMKKAEKLKEKGRKGSIERFASASSDVDAAKAQWDSQAPSVFEKLQTVDEGRFNHLRDILTQLETHEVDQVERNRVAAEQCLNILLNLDTADEIKAYAIRASDKRRRPERPESRSVQSYNSPLIADATNAPSSSQDADTGELIEDKKTGRLKRLGTVFGRRRSTAPAKPTPTREKSASKLSTVDSNTSRSADPPVLSDQNWQAPSGSFMSPSMTQNFPPSPTTNSKDINPSEGIFTNGASEPQVSASLVNGPNQRDLAQLQDTSQPVAVPNSAPQESTRDAEGFTVPATANDPISLAQQEAASAGDNGGQGYNVNIREAPINEENADNETALANVANALRAQAAPTRRNGTLRGRRDVRNTVFVPGPVAITSPEPVTESGQTSQLASPIAAATGFSQPINFSPTAPDETLASDNQSVRSGMSLGQSVRSGPVIKHPEMTQSGLNASIIETVSAWFEQSRVLRASVIGELALAYVASSSTTPSNEALRLENFQVLEKVAPNPAFIIQSADKPGEYTLDVARLTPGPTPDIAFKYQVHFSDDLLQAQAPLLLSPAWKVEATQSSVIVSYSLNPAYGAAETLTLSNVFIVVHLDNSIKASSCQSKPTGTFARAQNLIYWRLGDLALTAGQGPQKLLARFQTPDGEAKPGAVEARWEINDATKGSGLGLSLASSPGAADPFADDSAATGEWKAVACAKKLVSGTYSAT